jgi:hypothetical protein
VRRLAVDEPLGKDVADGAARAEPVCESPAASQNPGTPGTGTEQGAAVRRDALGAVDEVGQLGLGEHRHATDRALEDLAEQLPVRREQLLGEVPRHAVHRPRHRVLLEAADEEPADLLAHVDEVFRIAQARRRRGSSRPGSGFVARCWWISGVIGMLTPTMAAICAAHMPPASITHSVRIAP